MMAAGTTVAQADTGHRYLTPAATTSTLLPVNVGDAGSFAILWKSGVSDVPNSQITGDVGTSPITGAAITGLTCAEVTGTHLLRERGWSSALQGRGRTLRERS